MERGDGEGDRQTNRPVEVGCCSGLPLPRALSLQTLAPGAPSSRGCRWAANSGRSRVLGRQLPRQAFATRLSPHSYPWGTSTGPSHHRLHRGLASSEHHRVSGDCFARPLGTLSPTPRSHLSLSLSENKERVWRGQSLEREGKRAYDRTLGNYRRSLEYNYMLGSRPRRLAPGCVQHLRRGSARSYH